MHTQPLPPPAPPARNRDIWRELPDLRRRRHRPALRRLAARSLAFAGAALLGGALFALWAWRR